MVSTDHTINQISRKIVSAYYKAKAVAARESRSSTADEYAMVKVIKSEIKNLIRINGFEAFAEAMLDVAEAMTLPRTAMSMMDRVLSSVLKEMEDEKKKKIADKAASNMNRSGMLDLRPCEAALTHVTLDGEFMGALRSAILCACPAGIFCNWIHAKVGDNDLERMFRSMRAKLDAFRSAGGSKKMYWAIPMFSNLIVNIGFDYEERASWDGKIDELYVLLDYGTRHTQNMQEIVPISSMSRSTYRRLVSDKQAAFVEKMIGPDQDVIFSQPCTDPAHTAFGDNKRVIDWAGRDTYRLLCAKFCMFYFGVCYLCIYKRDPEMLGSGILDLKAMSGGVDNLLNPTRT